MPRSTTQPRSPSVQKVLTQKHAQKHHALAQCSATQFKQPPGSVPKKCLGRMRVCKFEVAVSAQGVRQVGGTGSGAGLKRVKNGSETGQKRVKNGQTPVSTRFRPVFGPISTRLWPDFELKSGQNRVEIGSKSGSKRA